MNSLQNIFKKCNKIILEHNNIILSKKLNSLKSKLQIQCNNGHIFLRNYKSIYKKSLCKKCKIYKNENICKYIFENLFDDKFIKCRPEWLLNPKTNRRLELDGYNKKLKLAFEYDGEFHYKYVRSKKYYSKQLNDQKERDNIKNNLCKVNNITLIRIPYTIKKNDYQEYIIKQCYLNNISIINLSKIDIRNIKHISNKLDEIKLYGYNNNLKLLSSKLLNSKQKLEWKCNNNHIFLCTYYNLQKRKNKCQLCKNKT